MRARTERPLGASACQKIFIVRGDVAPRTVHASHFDPSRPAFLSLARQLFPDDREITSLR